MQEVRRRSKQAPQVQPHSGRVAQPFNLLFPRPRIHATRPSRPCLPAFSIFTFLISASLLLRIRYRVLVLVLLLYFRTVQFSFALRYDFPCNMNRAIQHGRIPPGPRGHSPAPLLESLLLRGSDFQVRQKTALAALLPPACAELAEWALVHPRNTLLFAGGRAIVSARKVDVREHSLAPTLLPSACPPKQEYREGGSSHSPLACPERSRGATSHCISNRNYYGLEIELSYCKQRDLIFSNRNLLGHPLVRLLFTPPANPRAGSALQAFILCVAIIFCRGVSGRERASSDRRLRENFRSFRAARTGAAWPRRGSLPCGGRRSNSVSFLPGCGRSGWRREGAGPFP